jgi:hypothetical protein
MLLIRIGWPSVRIVLYCLSRGDENHLSLRGQPGQVVAGVADPLQVASPRIFSDKSSDLRGFERRFRHIVAKKADWKP